MSIPIPLSIALALLLPQEPDAEAPPKAELVDVRCIWEEAPHNAFTDLIRHRDVFYCAFREGRGHVSSDGRLRVLASPEGEQWQSVASLSLQGFDLRDADLSTTPDGGLLLVGGAAPRAADGQRAPTGTVVSFSSDGKSWSAPELALAPGRWLWRVEWCGARAYGFAYGAQVGPGRIALLASADGRAWEMLLEDAGCPGVANEVALRFTVGDLAVALARRAGEPGTACVGRSAPPYSRWEWRDLGEFVGGPNLLRLPDGTWIAAGRRLSGGPHTMLYRLDLERGALSPLLRLPSGGDTSYPGLAWHDGLLWVSYYASHEDKARIYLARVRLEREAREDERR